MNEMAVKGIWGESMERVITEDQWARLGEDGHAWAFFEKSESKTLIWALDGSFAYLG